MSSPPLDELNGSRWDAVIAGGGLVGTALGVALSGAGLRTLLVDYGPGGTGLAGPGAKMPSRPLALSLVSRRILETLGIWALVAEFATPIEHIHVSHRGRFGATRLAAVDCGWPALGYVLPSEGLDTAMSEVVAQCAGLTRAQALATAQPGDPRQVVLTARDGAASVRVWGEVLVVADGGRSKLREGLGVAMEHRDFGHVGMVGTVTVARPRSGTAFERFTADGPLALLPVGDARWALVWSVKADDAPRLRTDDEHFRHTLLRTFGRRLGAITAVSPRLGVPLMGGWSRELVREGAVLLGNAAYQLHPVAGQGLNLHLRDVAALAETLVRSRRAGEELGSLRVLQGYRLWRERDHARVRKASELLLWTFATEHFPVPFARSLGLAAMDLAPGLKRRFAEAATGFQSDLPGLARGIPLVESSNP